RLRTVDDIPIEIPHREIARQTIVNLNRPQRRHALRLPITLDYAAPPSQVKELLLQAVASAQYVCREPEPRVFLKDFAESGVEYEIKFWMEDHGLYSDACDAIRSHIWYGLRRQGIRIPFPTRTLHLEQSGRDRPPKAE